MIHLLHRLKHCVICHMQKIRIFVLGDAVGILGDAVGILDHIRSIYNFKHSKDIQQPNYINLPD